MNIMNILPDEILQDLFKYRPRINKELQRLFKASIPSIYNDFINGANDIILTSIKQDDKNFTINDTLNKYYKKDHWYNQCYYGLLNEKYLNTFIYRKCGITKIDGITKSICEYIRNDLYDNYQNVYDDLCNYELQFYKDTIIRKYYDENINEFSILNRSEFLRFFNQYIKLNIFKIENEDSEEKDDENDISKKIYVYDYKKYINQIINFRNCFKNTNDYIPYTKTRKIIYKKNPNTYYKTNTEIKLVLENI